MRHTGDAVPGRLIHVVLDPHRTDRAIDQALSLRPSGRIRCAPQDVESVAVRYSLNVFIMEYRDDLRGDLSACLREIRRHSADIIRLAPVIAFVREPTRDNIRYLLGQGVDDIVLAAAGPREFWSRLKTLLGKPMEFFETDDYFGPDRRRGLPPQDLSEARIQRAPRDRFFVVRNEDGCHRVVEPTVGSAGQAA